MKKTVLLLSALTLMTGAAISQVSGLDLLVHYPFQGFTADASGNGRNAQTTHTWYETGANGVANYAIAVDGDSASTISYDYSSEWNNFNFQSYTISTWARFDHLQTNYSNIFEMGNGQVFLRLQNENGSVGYPSFGVFTTGGNWIGSNGATGQLLNFWQEWHHFTLTSELDWSGTNRTFKLYIDGVLYQTENVNGSMSTEAMINHNAVGNGGTAISIGYRPFNSNLATNGNFQDFFLYARAVSATEVTELYEHLCQPGFATINASACDSYSLNGQNYYQSGTYTQVIPKSDGCDSTITLNLTVNETPYAEITQNGQDLAATSTAGAYQWIDCAANTAIANSNNQVFTPVATGQYAVILINGSCSDTSDCFGFTLGLNEVSLTGITLYPNPATDQLKVGGLHAEASVMIYDAVGRVVLLQTLSPAQNSIWVSELTPGAYTLVLHSEGKTARQHIQITK